MRRALVLLAIAALGVAMYSEIGWAKRQYERALRERVKSVDDYVDIGIELHVVERDDGGAELLRGKPKIRIVHTHRAGGIVDTRKRALIARSRNPVQWYCSEAQYPIIRHANDAKLGVQVVGSEGSGKTTLLPMWFYFRILEALGEGREGGLVAPTNRKLRGFLSEWNRLHPPHWFNYVKSEDVITFCEGTRIQLVSAHQRSKDEGSPVQMYSWSFAAADEVQDQVERHEDIEARGRSAKEVTLADGSKLVRYKQCRTCTPKDSTKFREYLSKLDASKEWWERKQLFGPDSPFVGPQHWERLKSTMSKRDYERRVLALDLPPELAVYYGWDRKRNLVPQPRIATDVTAEVLSDFASYVLPGARFTHLGGHDPGNIFNTTEIARLLMFDNVPTWVVVGEYETKQTSAREHAMKLREYLQRKHGIELDDYDLRTKQPRPDPESAKAAIICDPHGKGQSETDYQTVYMAMQRYWLDVFSPSRKRIKRSARVAMINRLLCDANGVARLVIACDEQGKPVAPRLVEAFESLEKRPGDDDPEGSQSKDEDDKTHAPAALGYMLWLFEQEAFTFETIRRAREAAARRRA